jgi:hypothetical protein
MDQLIPITEELKRKVKLAGENNLTNAQLAIQLGINEADVRILLYDNPELEIIRSSTKLQIAADNLQIVKDIAANSDPDNKQRLNAAKYLYEMFSGYTSQQPQTMVAIQNITHRESNHKLLDILPADVIEAIDND